jgi:hypothetical protein
MEETSNSVDRPSATRPCLKRTPPGLWLLMGVMHGAAILFVTLVLAVPFVSQNLIESVTLARQWSSLEELMGREVLIHLGISAALWATLYLIWLAMKASVPEVGAALRRARGVVLVETLIVLPVLLTMVFGLAQLAVINVAGMLTNLAAVHAGRTVWLWHPETRPIGGGATRGGVTTDRVKELARVQAAMALVPVAPGDLRIEAEVGSDLARMMRGSLVANQLQYLPNDAGRIGIAEARKFGDGGGENAGDDLSFARAMDGTSFVVRTARKFSAAYLATDVRILERGDWVGAEVTYKQLAAFPLTGRIFGTPEVVGQRRGYYTTIVREFDLKRQPEPNAKFPRRGR